MLPILAVGASAVGLNVLQSIGKQTGILKSPQTATASTTDGAAPDPAAFQKLMAKISSSPEIQQASFLAAEGIKNNDDASQRMAELSARVMQDPEVQKAIAGNSDPVEMRFLPGGVVSLKLSDGREKTVTLQDDAKGAAEKGAKILATLKASGQSSLNTPIQSAFSNGSVAHAAAGVRYTPGSGTSTLLPA